MGFETYSRLMKLCEMRPYEPGEDLSSISVNREDTPRVGGMIARNSKNHQDQWYVTEQYFRDNFDPIPYGRV